MALFLKNIRLTQFRNFAQQERSASAPLVVLHGANGMGKTNIMEAISLLAPGRGLRSASLPDLQRQGALTPWAVFAELHAAKGALQLGTGLDAVSDKRVFRLNGETLKSQSELAEHTACLWLTPDMDRLLAEGAAARRRFLDRLVAAYDPAHQGRLNRFEKAARQRTHLLLQSRADPRWLNGLEQEMALAAMAIAASRVELLQALGKAAGERQGMFPQVSLALEGELENALEQGRPALLLEETYREKLMQDRPADAAAGGGEAGPRRTDFRAYHVAKNMTAELCSSGEQKALLLSLLLAHLRLLAQHRGFAPFLLLDDVAAHLDAARRADLFELVKASGAQCFMSGPDLEAFSALNGRADFWHIT